MLIYIKFQLLTVRDSSQSTQPLRATSSPASTTPPPLFASNLREMILKHIPTKYHNILRSAKLAMLVNGSQCRFSIGKFEFPCQPFRKLYVKYPKALRTNASSTSDSNITIIIASVCSVSVMLSIFGMVVVCYIRRRQKLSYVFTIDRDLPLSIPVSESQTSIV